ncbi:MAG: hypothetical protein JW715_02175 [Sedimentisphaerales bacterium]|nr:hypothetical protein [Sedimentisphaerales bacterium]
MVTKIANIFFLSTPIPTAPTASEAKIQQTINGAPSTTRGLLHVGSMISIRIAVPIPNPSSNADIFPNIITGPYSLSPASI